MENIRTCEFVSPKHPDKLCDQIADAILDECLKTDPNSRVAVEVLGGHEVITLSGEITCSTQPDILACVQSVVSEEVEVVSHITKQSPEIARGVDSGGAGDQGIMVGYATAETSSMMPLEYELARSLCQKVFALYPYDGKVQVTLRGSTVETVVVSFQNTASPELEKIVRQLITAEHYLINPAGEWKLGGFAADSGATGRKLVIDHYGPQVPIGGGAFSGKDATKVDRSAAYMARHIACDYISQGAKEAMVKLAYAIGQTHPVMAVARIDGQDSIVQGYDLRPQAIIELLQLRQSQFRITAEQGHFGRNSKWD